VSAGVQAVVDLAVNEAPAIASREFVYCRFPLLDSAGNESWRVRAAVDCVAGALSRDIPTLVCCGAGMSRAPAIVAAALSVVLGSSLEECLATVTRQAALISAPAS